MYTYLEQKCSDALARCLGNEVLLQHPPTFKRAPSLDLGDVAIPCFSYAKLIGKELEKLGAELVETFSADPAFKKAGFKRGFLNLTFANELLFEAAVSAVDLAETRCGSKQIMVEYLSPNTNKPLHLGHVRNGVLGSAVANILAFVGHKVVRTELVNDRGVHICKSMHAYMKHGDGKTPLSTRQKGDHFVGDYYVLFAKLAANDPNLEQQAEAMLRQWENGDEEVISLWRKMTDWVLGGIAATEKRFGFNFDTKYFESDLYLSGKDIVIQGLEQGVFRKDVRDNIVFDLPASFGQNEDKTGLLATVLRNDGTGIYLTQDLGVAVKKATDYDLDHSVYVVAREQDDYFRRLFTILSALGFKWAEACHHLSYEMVELPSGKMKSREGTVVDADDLANEMASLAAQEIRAKAPTDASLDDEDVARRAEIIGMAAIKFYMLRFGLKTRIRFDPAASVSFEGDTGPYCLYAAVRANKLLERAAELGLDPAQTGLRLLGNKEERALALDLLDLPGAVSRSAKMYDPTILAEQVLKIARSFSAFYTQHKVISESVEIETTRERLRLVRAARTALENGLSLLGIDTVTSM